MKKYIFRKLLIKEKPRGSSFKMTKNAYCTSTFYSVKLVGWSLKVNLLAVLELKYKISVRLKCQEKKFWYFIAIFYLYFFISSYHLEGSTFKHKVMIKAPS